MITIDQLKQLTKGYKPAFPLNELTDSINQTFEKYNIDTNLRQIHFLAQTLYESLVYTRKRENLNYSANALLAVFPSKFKSIEEANKFHRQPEKIANKVYGNRYGNIHPNDGWKFRGGGSIQ